VGGGGKGLFLEQLLQSLVEFLPIAFDPQKVVPALFQMDLWQRALEFLARFVKTTRVPKPMTSVREENPTPQARIQESRKQAKPATKLNPMAFPPEKPIAYLQEREWRLVKPEKPGKAWCVDSDGVSWFRPRVGHDLQLVVLPDNETLRLAIECEFIRNRLVLPDRPPLQLISSELLRRI